MTRASFAGESDFNGHNKSTVFKMYVGDDKELLSVSINHNCKNNVTRFTADKRTEITKGKKLTNPILFPLTLILPARGLKLEASLAHDKLGFNLKVNDVPF